MAVLPDGRVVTGGNDWRLVVWAPARTGTQVVQLNCSVTALAAEPLSRNKSDLVVAHECNGFSFWSFT